MLLETNTVLTDFTINFITIYSNSLTDQTIVYKEYSINS